MFQTNVSAEEMFQAALKTGTDIVQTKTLVLPVFGKPKMPPVMPLGTRFVVCGDPKAGKSTMAATARNPVILDFEPGRLNYVDVPRLSPLYFPPDVDPATLPKPFNCILSDDRIVQMRKQLDFLVKWMDAVCDVLCQDGGQTFQTVIIDTLDTFIDLALAAYRADNGGPSKDQRQDYRSMYGKILPVIQRFTDRLPIDQIYVCHTETFSVNNEKETFLTVPEKIREWVASHVEVIGYIYKPDANNMPNRFYTAGRKGWPTGDGTGMLNADLPTHMGAVYAHWTGDEPENYQPTYERFKVAAVDQAPQLKPQQGK